MRAKDTTAFQTAFYWDRGRLARMATSANRLSGRVFALRAHCGRDAAIPVVASLAQTVSLRRNLAACVTLPIWLLEAH
jgi:hypothetical protein